MINRLLIGAYLFLVAFSLVWLIVAPLWQDTNVIYHRYFATLSPPVLIVLLATSLFAVVVLLRTPVAPSDQARAAALRYQPVAPLAIVGGLVAMSILAPFDNLPVAFWMLVNLVTASVLYWRWFGSGETPARAWLWLAIAASVVVIAARLLALSVYPTIESTDEGWTYSWVVNVLRTGQLDDSILLDRVVGASLPPYYYLASVWVSLVDGGLWEARLFSVLMSAIMIAFTALAARRIFGGSAGIWAALWTLATGALVAAARFRHDVGLGVMLALALWLYAEAVHRKSLALHFLAGLSVGLGGLAHLHAVLFGAALLLGLYAPAAWARVRARQHPFTPASIVFALGGLLGAAVLFLTSTHLFSSGGMAYVGTQIGFFEIPQNVVGHVLRLIWFSPFEMILIAVGTAAALLRRRPFDLAIALSLILCHVVLGVEGVLADHYLVPLAPLYTLITLIAADVWLEQTGAKGWALRQGHVLSLAAFTLALGLATTQPAFRYVLEGGPLRLPEPPAAIWVREHFPTTATVVAEHTYYFWLRDYIFGSPWITPYLQHAEPERYPDAASVWQDIPVDVFIIDDRERAADFIGELRDGYLESHGYMLAATFDTAEIYVREASGG